MIIYSGTQNRRFQVTKVVNEAQKTKKHKYNPHNGFIRQYHSVTRDQEKVILNGCGRDVRPGLGLLFMEQERKNGKNKVSDFEEGKAQNNDDWMDALAVTPCCLRKVTTLDNKFLTRGLRVGYIPLSNDDPNIHTERAQEEALGFSECDCSTCIPAEAEALIKGFQQLTASNFDGGLENPFSIAKDPTLVILTRNRNKQAHKGTCSYPSPVANDLVQYLTDQFEEFYYNLSQPKVCDSSRQQK
ncbi:hypothetical protein PSTG_00598 [Puccinia striiformis f. sp. tritici PST-78]|uniref:Uncharacterized protein n=1 Tax=Puccinia striiformis f. sp. tritici PST-78 TaxID=1165861 RepID=A0A0L0W3J7_9BASI|nr:hypothetical protein PSTG_00598 [Puccinia striiformis f. sp. tritici PST-78]